MDPRRLAAVAAALWAGLILGIGLIAAPAAFAVLQRSVAGAVVGHIFTHEAYAGLVFSALLLWAVRRVARADAAQGHGSQFSLSFVLVLVALFCTVFGHFGLQPMMTAARAGEGALSFAALHGISAALFVLKGLVLAALAWRLTQPPA
ncbi:DUF4149 domain-containing protein [Piscinibacter sp. HJYY11]|uniref:DUF4149 domain-containing protein n=1 Tax=Piscinibacter sp. HJYY11 TaxID=2801333 RepID=UPI00191F62E5|nr:DUF4149 domain-containing protein [Piscinibacter sp. HJYY11]MBL0731098.1 DUF4149 domain-containing protein [Piscinibacter sp. HJYY11]